MAMKLTRYDIIKGPVISDKAYKLNRGDNQLVLWVHMEANKPLIKDAIEALFNVKVKKIRTLIQKKSRKRATQQRYNASPTIAREKIAYVTLAEGYSLNLFDQAGATQVDESKQVKAEG
jgi:large subunit ribosomal protein L23